MDFRTVALVLALAAYAAIWLAILWAIKTEARK